MMEGTGKRFLVVGGDSVIGAALVSRLKAAGFAVQGSTRRDQPGTKGDFSLDLSHEPQNFKLPHGDVIYLAAAMTRLSDCRANPELAAKINARAPIEIAKLAIQGGAFVVFLSTNQVFDGSMAHTPAGEATRPKSVYGKLKAEAENSIRALGERVAIVRLGKCIGRHLPLFEGWKERLLAGKPVEAYTDLFMPPISLGTAVSGLQAIGTKCASGTWHLCGRDDISYFDAAVHLASKLGATPNLVLARRAADAGAIPPEERPRHTALALGDIESALGITIASPFEELELGLELS